MIVPKNYCTSTDVCIGLDHHVQSSYFKVSWYSRHIFCHFFKGKQLCAFLLTLLVTRNLISKLFPNRGDPIDNMVKTFLAEFAPLQVYRFLLRVRSDCNYYFSIKLKWKQRFYLQFSHESVRNSHRFWINREGFTGVGS